MTAALEDGSKPQGFLSSLLCQRLACGEHQHLLQLDHRPRVRLPKSVTFRPLRHDNLSLFQRTKRLIIHDRASQPGVTLLALRFGVSVLGLVVNSNTCFFSTFNVH